MRKFAAPLAVLICLFAAQSAAADIPNVFGSVTCTVQGSGARFCGTVAGTTVASWDGTPIDVSMAFPPASGSDTNWPVIGVFHGWGGTKILPAAMARFVNQGYAVFSVTDRGWGASCGGPSLVTLKAAPCTNGYIRLMHNAYEVRDVQYLLGKLADQHVIDPQRIGATGGSYGGGLSVQLGALKDRVQMTDGSLVQWQSPDGTAMRVAATAPEFPWTDLAQSLMPNGSSLDYVADAPYLGMLGDHRFGIQKQNWNFSLFFAGQGAGYLAPASLAPQSANLINWNNLNSGGGPYDGQPLAQQQIQELPNHGAYYTDLSQPPAPALLSSGWNDDLFPVDETVRYYNKVRAKFPNAAIKLFELNFGHSPRANAAAGDVAKLTAAEDAWFAYYVKGAGSEPAAAKGGVDILTSACPAGTLGTQFTAPNWDSLAPGEVRVTGSAQQTIAAPGTIPGNAFTSGNVCSTQAGGDIAADANYKTDPASGSGYTLAGSPTVIAEFDTPGANDMVAARLYDVDPAAPLATQQRLIARGLYRPTNVGEGFKKQVFQLHPQAYRIAPGHVVKLELATRDDSAINTNLSYARNAVGRNSVQVRNLELRLPTIDAPGSAGGAVQEPADKYVPQGYRLARDVQIEVPGAPHIATGDNPNATGVFSLEWSAAEPADGLVYGLQHRDSNDAGWSSVDNAVATNAFDFSGSPEGEGTWKYHVDAHSSSDYTATIFSDDSAPIKVDKTAPNAPSVSADRAPDHGDWYTDTVDVSVTDNGDPDLSDGSPGSGVDVGSLPATATYNTSGSHDTTASAEDTVGNESESASLTVQVDATDPNLSVACPSAVLLNAAGVTTTVTASDYESGLAEDPSETLAIDTSAVGPQTFTRTAVDNVGHSVTESCTTQVQYMFSGVLQPINPDDSSIFKLGSTVPVRFALTDAQAASIGSAVATLSLAKISNDVEGSFNEAVSTSNATTGSLFRSDGAGHYVFNLSTKGLSAGTWSLKITLDDGMPYKTQISLR